MSEELIEWLEAKADQHDTMTEHCSEGSEDAQHERLEAIRYRQCIAQLAEAQKVEPSMVTLYVSNGEVDLAGLSELAKELPDGEYELYTSPPPQEGMVSVPVEPTDAMRKAFWKAEEYCDAGVGEMPDSAWKAMLKAAQGEG